jgi:hypothetical protein
MSNWDGKTERRSDTSTVLQWLSEFGSEIRKDVKDTICELRVDIKVIKDDVKTLDNKVIEIDKTLSNFNIKVFDEDTGIITKVEEHDKLFKGNGKPGLIKEISNITSEFDKFKSILSIEDFKKLNSEFSNLKVKIYTIAGIIGFISGILGWVIPIIIMYYKG